MRVLQGLLLLLVGFVMNGSALASDQFVHCGNTDGSSSVYFDLSAKKIYINRDEDNLKTAVEMIVTSFNQGNSPFSLEAKATHPLLGIHATFGFQVSPNSDGTSGTLSLTVTTSDSSASADPSNCQLR